MKMNNIDYQIILDYVHNLTKLGRTQSQFSLPSI